MPGGQYRDLEHAAKGTTQVVNEGDDASWVAAITQMIKDMRGEIRELRTEVRQCRSEVRQCRTDHDTARAAAAGAIVTALSDHFGPLHEKTAERLGAVEERVEAVEGCLDLSKLFRIGDGAPTPGIRDVYRDVDRAAKRATRKGRAQRVDIPDGEHSIIAHIQPGADPVTVIRTICAGQ